MQASNVMKQLECAADTRAAAEISRLRRSGPDLLVLIRETVLDDVHQCLQVRQHTTAEQDRDLLHDLDARVPRLHKQHEKESELHIRHCRWSEAACHARVHMTARS